MWERLKVEEGEYGCGEGQYDDGQAHDTGIAQFFLKRNRLYAPVDAGVEFFL